MRGDGTHPMDRVFRGADEPLDESLFEGAEARARAARGGRWVVPQDAHGAGGHEAVIIRFPGVDVELSVAEAADLVVALGKKLSRPELVDAMRRSRGHS